MSLGLRLKIVMVVLTLALIGVGFLPISDTYADGAANSAELVNALSELPGYCSGASCSTRTSDIQTNVINTLLLVAGTIAVAMVIFGGVQMTTSAGNPATVTKAKRTILFSIIGLVVVILAYAIVNFVVDKI